MEPVAGERECARGGGSDAMPRRTCAVRGGPRLSARLCAGQTAYGALQPPSTYFGLGRTNNYVESLFVGSTRRQPEPVLVLEGVIPNSEVVVIPTQPDAGGSPEHWRRELFLHPADWVPAVTLALGALIAVLGLIVFGLDLREKREDERERQRAVHAINFDAL